MPVFSAAPGAPAAELSRLYRALDPGNDFRNKNLNELICSHVRGRSVLDIGCGAGGLCRELSRRGKSVVGLEPRGDLLEMARGALPRCDIRQGRAEELGILFSAQEAFDTALLIDVLEHVSDDRSVLRAVYERITPGGRLIVVAPAHPRLYGPRDQRMGHYRRYSREGLGNRLLGAGFGVARMRYWNMLGFLPYLACQKLLMPGWEDCGLRMKGLKGWPERRVIRLLDMWYRFAENRTDFGFGLSLFALGEKARRP